MGPLTRDVVDPQAMRDWLWSDVGIVQARALCPHCVFGKTMIRVADSKERIEASCVHCNGAGWKVAN